MARFPKTLGDILAAQAESSRDTRTSVLATPELALLEEANLAEGAVTGTKLSADAIDGKTITGATIIGGVVKTSGAAGQVVGRMGPSAIANTGGGTYPGIGFVVEGSSGLNNPGLYSTDGDNLSIQGGNGGSTGMNYITMEANSLSMYSYAPASLASRGILSLEGGRNGAALAGVYIKGSRNQIDGETYINGMRVGENLQHAEFTASMSVPSGTLWGPGSFTLVPSMSVNPGFVSSARPDYLTVSVAGVYNIQTLIDTGSNTATSSQCVVRRVVGNTLVTGANKAAGAYEFPVPSGNVYLAAGTELKWTYYQANGAAQTWNTSVRITRIASMAAVGSLPTGDHTFSGDLTTMGTNKTPYTVSGTPRRIPVGIIQRVYATGGLSFGTTDTTLLQTASMAVRPGSLLRVTGAYTGYGSVHNQWSSWYLRAGGTTFYQHGHYAATSGFGQGNSFVGYYQVPAGVTSMSFSMVAIVAAGGGTFTINAPTPPNYPLSMNIEDVGDY